MTERGVTSGPPLRIAAIVTSYRTWPLALRAAEAISRLEPDLDEVVIVDDASGEAPPASLPEGVKVEVNPERLGLVRSLNLAFDRRAAEIVVHFDSDARPLVPFAGALREAFASDHRLAVCGFRTVDRLGSPTGSARPVPTLGSLLAGQRLSALFGRLRFREEQARLSVFACAIAVRRQFFEEAGGFHPPLEWLELDHDLCMKAWERGWTARQLPELVAEHEGGGAPQSTEERVRRWHRSRWLLLAHHGKIRHPRLVAILLHFRLRLERALLLVAAVLRPSSRARLQAKAAGRAVILEDLRKGYE